LSTRKKDLDIVRRDWLSESLTSISAKPNRFSPFQVKGFSMFSCSAESPIPQILS